MAPLHVSPLAEDIAFGAKVVGVDRAGLGNEATRQQIKDLFENCGILVFENVEPSGQLQVELAGVFGPLQEHAMAKVRGGDGDSPPGVYVLNFHPDDTDIFEVNGKALSGWVPWHFDACYSDRLYRGAVLRALDIPPQGGLTGFVDGVQLYNAISPELRAQFEGRNIVYHPGLMLSKQRFGLPAQFRTIRMKKSSEDLIASFDNAPRAVHPAIWRRASGEKVLHVSPWQAACIEGQENAEGDALLEALCQEIYVKSKPYWHSWKPTDMLIWDNWRFIHAVSGHDPSHVRRMHRAGIAGDYGLGRWENAATGSEIFAATSVMLG